MRKRDSAGVEALLRERELWYVAASGRFINRHETGARTWVLKDSKKNISSLAIYSKRNLLPVFCGKKDIPPPRFLNGFFGMLPVYSVQGLRDEVIFFERCLEALGLQAVEKIDYDLMSIDRKLNVDTDMGNLILRVPTYADVDALAVLQAGYEQEEVLPRGATFYPAASRLNTEKIGMGGRVLAAELGGRLVGKINVSAESFTRFQVGGVYVHPDFRGAGIARRMTAAFVSSLIAQGKGVSLFVRKSNNAAISVYRRLGFKFLADYRISYY
jgi:ribosomal protein S18 acetylase RimI-like enzyme